MIRTWPIAITLVNFACLGADTGKKVDSETHFLTICQSDTECGGDNTCLCGFCTKPCDPAAASGCGAGTCANASLFESPRCVVTDLLPELGGLCAEPCDSQSCGPGFECQPDDIPRVCVPLGNSTEPDDAPETTDTNDTNDTKNTSGTSDTQDGDSEVAADVHLETAMCARDEECSGSPGTAVSCVDGACLQSCGLGDVSCPEGQVCWIWGDVVGVCVPKCQNCEGACPGSLTCKPINEVNPMIACLPATFLGGAETPPCTGLRPRGAPCANAEECEDGACSQGYCGGVCQNDGDCNGAVCYEGHCFSRCGMCGQADECVPGSSCRTVEEEGLREQRDHTKLACVPYPLQRPIEDLLTSQQYMCGDWCTDLCAGRECGVPGTGCSCGTCAEGSACRGGTCIGVEACGGQSCPDALGGAVCLGQPYYAACADGEYRRCTYCAAEGAETSCDSGCVPLAMPFSDGP